ncbi:MAG: prephenate dehydrogenase [Deltaproteobacteria bacterium]|nr:prephenate dehydrogenase [Deltaproteobacteria bacterium]
MRDAIGIIGLGLIGGSLARALKRARPSLEIVGADADADSRAQAVGAGAIDRGYALTEAPLESCGLVVLAVPGPTLLAILPEVAARLAPGAILSDVGGSKGPICAAAAAQAHALFVGAHPMAGTEFRGFAASRVDLFDGCVVAQCAPRGGPASVTDADREAAAKRVTELWTLAGAARVLNVDPEEHDRAVTFASHLPYLAAAAVTEALIDSGAVAPLARELAAGGFRDTTRLAGDGTVSGAAAQNRFLPDAARALAKVLTDYADRLEAAPEPLRTHLARLADERRAMKLPIRKA